MGRFDYLIIGHITHDATESGNRVGGSVAYAGRTAQVLGCRTAVLTSAGPDCDAQDALRELTVRTVPAPHTTHFENQYSHNGRTQRINERAVPIEPSHLPEAWRRTAIVHLAPVAAEVDPALLEQFSNSMVGLTPQGWLRGWNEEGDVYARPWPPAQDIFPLAAAVILSEEDLADPEMVMDFRRWSRLLVVTRGERGCTVYLGKEERSFPAPVVAVRDLTGAGDIFAAAFLVRLYHTKGNPWEAASFANLMAAESVTQPDLDTKMEHLATLRS